MFFTNRDFFILMADICIIFIFIDIKQLYYYKGVWRLYIYIFYYIYICRLLAFHTNFDGLYGDLHYLAVPAVRILSLTVVLNAFIFKLTFVKNPVNPQSIGQQPGTQPVQ